MGHTSLRLHQRLACNSTSRKTIISESQENQRQSDGPDDCSRRESSKPNNLIGTPPIRIHAVEADSCQPASAGKQTAQQYGVNAPSDNLTASKFPSTNIPSGTLSSSGSFGHMPARRPVPLVLASVSEGFQRSTSHTSSFKNLVTTPPVSAVPASTGSMSSVYPMKRTVYNASLSPRPISNTTDVNKLEVKNDANDLLESSDKVTRDRHNSPYYTSSYVQDKPSDRKPTTPDWTASNTSADLGANSEPTAVESPFRSKSKVGASSVRHTQAHPSPDATDDYRRLQLKDLPYIQEPTSHHVQPNMSYFNYRTGVELSDAPLPAHSGPFSLAKTYTDWDTPLSSGAYAIPMSPEMNEGSTAPTATNKLYSSSPLSKSPGKRFVGKMVDVAKKAVPAGMKYRAGNLNRLMSNDRLFLAGSMAKDRLPPHHLPAISHAQSLMERQEVEDLQPHWGNELYGPTVPTQETIAASTADLECGFPEIPKERELPVSDAFYRRLAVLNNFRNSH